MLEENGLRVGAVRGEQHLTKTAQYALVYNKGNAWVNDLLVLKALPNALGLSRYGFSVSRRLGGAVVRNRVKRVLREILRRMPLKPGWDIIFIARSKAAKAGYAEFNKSVTGLLSKSELLTEEHEEVCPGIN